MNIDELLSRFDSLYREFYSEQKEYTEQLRNLLIEFNDSSYEYKLDSKTTVILSEASIEQMKCIVENLRIRRQQEKNEQIQSPIREQQIGRNKYGPNNEYR